MRETGANGHTHLMTAAHCGNVNAIKIWLPSSDSNAEDGHGQTAFGLALENGQFAAAKAIAEKVDVLGAKTRRM